MLAIYTEIIFVKHLPNDVLFIISETQLCRIGLTKCLIFVYVQSRFSNLVLQRAKSMHIVHPNDICVKTKTRHTSTK